MKKQKKKGNRKGGKQIKHIFEAGIILLLGSGGILLFSSKVPAFARWYSENVYPLLVASVGRISGFLPFSAGEILIYLLLAVFAGTGLYTLIRSIRRGNGKERAFRWISGVLLGAGILFFLYTAGCGVNYYRTSFAEQEGIRTYSYSSDELQQICIWLTEEVNARSANVSRDENGVLKLDAPEGEGAVEAMERLSEKFPSLEGYYPLPKKLAVPEILSFQGLTGIYLPFTVEANYNGDITAYTLPFTACHELSHLRGFMEEKEANFIAFLACINSERTDFQYSGYLSGWVYCMNALYRTDRDKWLETREQLDIRAEKDLDANNLFWDRYEGPVRETAEQINDTYLKVNGQADGVESYDRMVDLIVAYFGEER